MSIGTPNTTVGGSDGSKNNVVHVDRNGRLAVIKDGADLYTYTFAPTTGSATLSGYFADGDGMQVTEVKTFTITTATSLIALYNAAAGNVAGTRLPTNFLIFYGQISAGDLYMGNGANPDGTLKFTPQVGYPIITSQNFIKIGRC